MLTTFFISILNFFKRYFLIIGLILFIIIGSKWAYNKIDTLEKENARQSKNLINKDFDITMSRTISGQLAYSVKQLSVKADELQSYNEDIVKKLEDMGVKIKKVQSVTNLNYHYSTILDTIETTRITETKFNFRNSDKYISTSGEINILPNKNPIVSNLNFVVSDTLLIAPEITYKRVWLFWKKPNGIKVHVKSENPNFHLEQFRTFEIVK